MMKQLFDADSDQYLLTPHWHNVLNQSLISASRLQFNTNVTTATKNISIPHGPGLRPGLLLESKVGGRVELINPVNLGGHRVSVCACVCVCVCARVCVFSWLTPADEPSSQSQPPFMLAACRSAWQPHAHEGSGVHVCLHHCVCVCMHVCAFAQGMEDYRCWTYTRKWAQGLPGVHGMACVHVRMCVCVCVCVRMCVRMCACVHCNKASNVLLARWLSALKDQWAKSISGIIALHGKYS